MILYLLIPQLSTIKSDIHIIASGNPVWLLAGLAVSLFVPVFLSLTYRVISIVPLKLNTTILVSWAAYIPNAIVPSGLGGMAVFTYYLKKVGHSVNQTGAVIAEYELVDFASYIILGTAAVLATGISISNLSTSGISVPPPFIKLLAVIIIATIIILWRRGGLRRKLHGGLVALKKDLAEFAKQPKKMLLATTYSGLNSTFLVITLYASCHAFGIQINLAEAFVAYILGSVLGTAVPTPGGLGGVEAGLYAGITSFGYPESATLTAVLTYRAITFWLPLIPSYFSINWLRKDTLAGFKL